jgi:hypothetical protein
MRQILNALSAICLLTLGAAVAGCQSGPTATEMLAPGQSQVSVRSIQTRAFDTTDRTRVMRTVIATLQDLEFVIDQGDETLSMVGATKLDNYNLRMTVTARPRDESQTLVRANASLNQTVVGDADLYQQFFVSLEHALFLAAHGVD